MKSDPIQDYILTSEQNLCIAATVYETWPEARDQLVSEFLNRLRLKLLAQLNNWEFGKSERFFIDRDPCWYFWKPAWTDQYSVILQCPNYGERMQFGLSRDETHIKNRSFCPEALDAVKTIHPSAKAVPWYEALVTMRSPSPDWRRPEVLWRMRVDIKFLDDVAEQLLEVAKIVEPIIDGLVRKK